MQKLYTIIEVDMIKKITPNIEQKIINKTQASGKVLNMKETIKKSFADLCNQAENYVTEYGDFSKVFVKIVNTDKNLYADEFLLTITKPPKGIQNHEKIRNFELVAYKNNSPYKISRMLATAESKQELLDKIKNDETLFDKIEKSFVEMSHNLEDI